MIDPTEKEIAALLHASTVAGEHLEQLGKAEPFAALTREEWMALLETIVTAYLEQTCDPAAPVKGVPF